MRYPSEKIRKGGISSSMRRVLKVVEEDLELYDLHNIRGVFRYGEDVSIMEAHLDLWIPI